MKKEVAKMTNAIYEVSYDLMNPGKDYSELTKILKSFPGWCHTLKSMWYIKSDLDIYSIKTKILQVMDNNDKLVISRLIYPIVSNNLSTEISEWIKSNNLN